MTNENVPNKSESQNYGRITKNKCYEKIGSINKNDSYVCVWLQSLDSLQKIAIEKVMCM